MINIHSLSIGYKQKRKINCLQKDINFSCNEGDFTLLIGKNGCGKSTLIKTIYGILPPFSGTISVNKQDISDFSIHERSKLISVVLTKRIYSEKFIVEDVVAIGRHPYTGILGRLSEKDHKIITHSMEDIGILSLAKRDINSLSDGEFQKVMLARAIAQECPILLLDEPSSFLDYPSKIELYQLLKKLCEEQNKTVILSTHDIQLAIPYSSHILLMKKEFETIYLDATKNDTEELINSYLLKK